MFGQTWVGYKIVSMATEFIAKANGDSPEVAKTKGQIRGAAFAAVTAVITADPVGAAATAADIASDSGPSSGPK